MKTEDGVGTWEKVEEKRKRRRQAGRQAGKEGKTVSLGGKDRRGAEVGGPDSQNHQRKFEWDGISYNRCNHLPLGTSTASA